MRLTRWHIGALIVVLLAVFCPIKSDAGNYQTPHLSGWWCEPGTSPNIKSGAAGAWCKSSDGLPYWRKSDGTDTAMTGGGGGGGYSTIEENGSSLTQRSTLNFSSKFSCVDNAGSTRTDCDLATSGATAGTYGDATHTPQVTVDAAGRVTSVSNVASSGGMSIGGTVVSGTDTDILFVSGGNLAQSSNLAWNNSTQNMVVGDGLGSAELDVFGGLIATGTLSATGHINVPTIGPNGTHQGTLQSVNDTFVYRASTDTLTNKTLTAPLINGCTSSGSTSIDFSGNSGAFKATTGAATFGGSSNSFTNGIGVDSSHQNALPSVNGSTLAALGLAQTWTKSQNVAAVALTDGASIATDASLGNSFTVTLGGNRTLSNPTNLVSGGTYLWTVTQDGTGSRTLAYDTNFKWPGGVAPTLSTAAGAVDVITCSYTGLTLKCVAQLNFQ